MRSPTRRFSVLATRLLQVALLAVIALGVAARIAALPGWVPDSGDEWGNAVAPLRLLYERGHPGTFLHPALFYEVTAAAYAAMYGVVRLFDLAPQAGSLTDLFVADERWFTRTARAVSVAAAILTMGALYAFGRMLWDRTAGLWAAALLAALPLHAVYSEAVRVDSLFVLLFVVAAWQIVALVGRTDRAAADLAALCSGLAIAANYNGALLLPWLLAATWRRPAGGAWRALCLAGAAFLVANPYVLLDAGGFLRQGSFIASLSVVEHPGMEGRGPLFYVGRLVDDAPLLAAAIAAAAVAVAAGGTRRERVLLSVAVAYVVVFSLLRTKFDRFILPGLALLLLVAAGLPTLLARRGARRRWAANGAALLATALLLAALAGLLPRSVPVPRHAMLPRADGTVLDWLERHAAPRSRIHVQSGVLPLIDVLGQPGPLAEALRASLARTRPGLDHTWLVAVHIGGRAHYEAGVLTAQRVDYAVISRRTLQAGAIRCGELPEVCAVLEELQRRGAVVFTSADGVEPVVIYDLRGRQPPAAGAHDNRLSTARIPSRTADRWAERPLAARTSSRWARYQS